MAIITKNIISGSEQIPVTNTILTASDTIEYTKGVNSTLVIFNMTAGAIAPLITGDQATTTPNSGAGNIDVSGGFLMTPIAPGETVAMPLDGISAYLKGAVTLTWADSASAYIAEYA